MPRRSAQKSQQRKNRFSLIHSPTQSAHRTSIRMSSSPSSDKIVEHIVLFKVKPSANPSAMLNNINSLFSLNIATHLSVGPITRCHSTNPNLTFTHMLHSRYPSKSALSTYLTHPSHLNVVANPAVDDVMVLDWEADNLSGSEVITPGSVARFTVLKLKEDEIGGKDNEVLEAVKGVFKDKFSEAGQLTVGMNFSPGRAKGYSIASVALLKDFDSGREVFANVDKVDDVLVFDLSVAPRVMSGATC